jgi:hypothetical protein
MLSGLEVMDPGSSGLQKASKVKGQSSDALSLILEVRWETKKKKND